jgi:hypothetical protein
MGVITYFLLAGSSSPILKYHFYQRFSFHIGYTPFDRDTQQLEMEAIIAGDYKFEPRASHFIFTFAITAYVFLGPVQRSIGRMFLTLLAHLLLNVLPLMRNPGLRPLKR